MGADKSFLNAEGMWYGGDSAISVAHLSERAAVVMPALKRPMPKAMAVKADQ